MNRSVLKALLTIQIQSPQRVDEAEATSRLEGS